MADLAAHVPRIALRIRPEQLAICQLGPDCTPSWERLGSGFWALAHTENELTLVLPEECIGPDGPADATAGARIERGWRCLEVIGPLAFSLTGILAQLSAPLAAAGIPIFVLSTYDTDEVLVRGTDLERAVAALTERGYRVQHEHGQQG
jgi:uncharacterized protein